MDALLRDASPTLRQRLEFDNILRTQRGPAILGWINSANRWGLVARQQGAASGQPGCRGLLGYFSLARLTAVCKWCSRVGSVSFAKAASGLADFASFSYSAMSFL
jgi:hypothetical protein